MKGISWRWLMAALLAVAAFALAACGDDDEPDDVPRQAALAHLHQPVVAPVGERLAPRHAQQAGGGLCWRTEHEPQPNPLVDANSPSQDATPHGPARCYRAGSPGP